MTNVRTILATALVATALATAAPAWAAKKGKVDVEIREWNVTVSENAVPAGEVEVNIKNKGKEVHEMVLVKLTTNDPVMRLPVDKNGAIDEKAMASWGKIVDETEGLEPGKKEKKKLNLKPGRYAFICNMVEQEKDGTIEAHYSKGMAAELIVE